MKLTNKNYLNILLWLFYDMKLKHIISRLTKCDNVPLEDINIITNWICRSGAPGGGTVYEVYTSTNVKQKEVSDVPSGTSKTSNVLGRWAGSGKKERKKEENNKNYINFMRSVTQRA